MATFIKKITATGDVTTGDTKLLAIGGNVTTAGDLVLRKGGGSGTIIGTIPFGINTHVYVLMPDGLRVQGGLHVTFSTLVGSLYFIT